MLICVFVYYRCELCCLPMNKMDDDDLLPDIANLDMIEEGLYLGM